MINKVAKWNKGNLENKTKEECAEFLEAFENYAIFCGRVRDWTKDVQRRQKLFEEVLHEIADCEVMKMQHEIHCTGFKLSDIIKGETYMKYQQLLIENLEYVNHVVKWKLARTLLRNKVGYYK